jgi:hypothetical protein
MPRFRRRPRIRTLRARDVIEALERGVSREKTKKPIGDDGPVPLVRCEEIVRSRLLLFSDGLFFKACDSLIEVVYRPFEGGDRSDERTEGDLHIM